MALSITAEQYSIAQSYAASGDYVGGWEYLSSIGDSYADNAAAVTGEAAGIQDIAFNKLVEVHWKNTAGAEAHNEKFDQVAKQHFQQYIEITSENGFMLPTKSQIEQSYRDAVVDAGLPPETAFDGVFTNTIGEALDPL